MHVYSLDIYIHLYKSKPLMNVNFVLRKLLESEAKRLGEKKWTRYSNLIFYANLTQNDTPYNICIWNVKTII